MAGTGAHRFVAHVTADATISAAAVQAAVLPWRGEEGRSTLTHTAPERAPMSLAALLAAMSPSLRWPRSVPGAVTRGPLSTLVALRRAVALRAPPCLRPA